MRIFEGPLKIINHWSVRVQLIDGLPDEFKFFIAEAMDEVLEELEKRSDDQGYESNSEENSDSSIDILLRHEGYKGWKDALTASIVKLIEISTDSMLIEPSINIILNYLSSVREMNVPTSATQLSFNEEDKRLKQAQIEYKSSSESKRKTQFLMNELYTIIQQVVDYTSHKLRRRYREMCHPLRLSDSHVSSCFSNHSDGRISHSQENLFIGNRIEDL